MVVAVLWFLIIQTAFRTKYNFLVAVELGFLSAAVMSDSAESSASVTKEQDPHEPFARVCSGCGLNLLISDRHDILLKLSKK